MNLTLSELYNAMYTGKENSGDVSFYGVVASKNLENGIVVSYNVEVGDSVIEARKLAGANVGDVVLCTTLNNGITAVTGALNGDKDAANAQSVANSANTTAQGAQTIAQGVANNLATNYLTASQIQTDYLTASYIQANYLTATEIQADYISATELETNYLTANQIAANYASIATLQTDYLSTTQIEAQYAKLNAANIDTAQIREAWIDKLMVQSNLLSHSGTIYELDAITLNANKITAGTLDVNRLVITNNNHKYLVQLDQLGQATYVKLDGDVLEDRTITADKIVAGAITANEITTQNIQGTGGWINLRNGTFNYLNAQNGQGISWDGTNLVVNANNLTIGNQDIVTRMSNIETTANDASDAADAASAAVTNIETIIRQYSNGVLVGKTGNTVGALVNANGSFDITNITWGGNVPTAGATLASFGSDGITLGKPYVEGALDNEGHLFQDYHSLQLLDETNTPYFYVSNLKNRAGIATIYQPFVVTYQMYDNYDVLPCSVDTVDEVLDVLDEDGVSIFPNIAFAEYRNNSLEIEFNTNDYLGDKCTIIYTTSSPLSKVFTFGSRLAGENVGGHSVVLGHECAATYSCSYAEGYQNISKGYASHAEGYQTQAKGDYSHAEGRNTTAGMNACHAEGGYTSAGSGYSHAEGFHTKATYPYAHAEGLYSEALTFGAHAEGEHCYAGDPDNVLSDTGQFSHAEGSYCITRKDYSHAQNRGTIASALASTTMGTYNIEDTNATTTTHPSGTRGYRQYALIIGNGEDDNNRSNAMTVAWNGNTAIAGTLIQSSDRRLKEHIDYLGNDAVDFIHNLKPAYFLKDNAKHLGFYAQDVEEIDKWNCMIGEMNGYKTLGYTEIIAPLVAYCQHLEKRIEELEKNA